MPPINETKNLGRVGYVNKGDWTNGLHKLHDIVKYAGSIYVCTLAHTSVSGSVLPTNTTYWHFLVGERMLPPPTSGQYIFIGGYNPTPALNLPLNTLWLNSVTFELFLCTDATQDLNVWKGNQNTTIQRVHIFDPILEVQGYPDGVLESPLITITNAFQTYAGYTDTLNSVDWRVVRVSDGAVVWQNLGDTVNTQKIRVPFGILQVFTQYSFQARYKGQQYVSNVGSLGARTGMVFHIRQGFKGFSVERHPADSLTAYGLGVMDGTYAVGWDNYGNYQHTDGSVVCWVPRQWYRIGHPDSPRYATYGANAIDILSLDMFMSEAEANASGYVLHRAFIDGGAMKEGFFIAKYLPSQKSGSTSVAVSVKNGIPIALTSNTAYIRSSTMGEGGVLYDAITLSKAKGAEWQCATIFMWAWLGIVQVAQAQAATNAIDVAWYDSSGTANCPKGCNNNLADANDPTVTWTSAGLPVAIGLTGSASNFAKSTHNGANNGIADLNGLMHEAVIGVTNAGTAYNTSAAIATDSVYMLKQSVSIKTLTAGFGASPNTWGTSSDLATLYDVVTSPYPLGSSAGAFLWGSGTNGTLSTATTGVARDFCGIVPKDVNGGGGGSNLFGADYHYRYNIENMVQLCGGAYDYGGGAGLFTREFAIHRTQDLSNTSFRFCAY